MLTCSPSGSYLLAPHPVLRIAWTIVHEEALGHLQDGKKHECEREDEEVIMKYLLRYNLSEAPRPLLPRFPEKRSSL